MILFCTRRIMESIKFFALVALLVVSLRTSDAQVPAAYEPPINFRTGNIDLYRICETCAANFITQDYRADWEDSVSVSSNAWTVALASKLHVYLMGLSMYQTNSYRYFADKHFDASCLLIQRLDSWDITNTTGFGGRFVTMRLTQTNLPKVYRFRMPFGPQGVATGTASIILADNQSYTVFEYCFDNGLRTFAVYNKDTSISFSDLESIKLHLKAIGYKERHFVEVDPWSKCDIRNELFPKDDDLPEPNPRSLNPAFPIFYSNAVFPVPPLFWKKK